MEKINQLLEVSKSVLVDCSLENGGIVAANTTKKNYPPQAKNYFYIWPRDAAFACIAADNLGISTIPENFFYWCMEYAEDFTKNGLFYEKYYPNGLKALHRFQPDQTGALLYAVWYHLTKVTKPSFSDIYTDLIQKAADGICSVWDADHFTLPANDLWEERMCFPDLRENFSYSLAACIRGLRAANEIIPSQRWEQVAQEMQARLDKHFIGYFIRSFGKIPDYSIDASMLGLVYPFEIYKASDQRMVDTVETLVQRLSINGGIHRYEHDEYDGWMTNGHHRNKGAGAWPLLNFWLAIYAHRNGEYATAKRYYYWVVERVEAEGYIPEQIFDNDIQVSVCPLLWSHVMFINASREMNLI